LPEKPTITVLVSVRPEWRACNRLYRAIHHPLVANLHHKLQQNTVDKNFQDGQNPYHSHSPSMTAKCKHPIVKVVAREDDVEFVECQACGEVFDSVEFSDMALEEEEASTEPPSED
jgi:hypothetical protein